ncbi:RHS repeat domain-containing protein [Endozoicomonas acroporae]|uniref:RHS repeat domain-containing protein n=1 Tax=Endozoicomonas acroporae TaxID=1701104 RepID=UPI0015E13F75|nr:RHS repeat-associated core domain-containing protein [Endozoicomonas acroporae]
MTRYVGNVEFITRPSGNREVKRYINGVVIDTKTTRAGSITISSVQLLFKDHLGSVHTIMNGNSMMVLQRQSFDPFGLRRDPTNWQVLLEEQLSLFNTQYTTRGFTGHEQLDEVGLIHMNGRVYDAKLGRFLQADPFIQALGNTQSFNRYSYVLNNPLNAVDPSGYFFKAIKRAFKKITRRVIRAVTKVFGPEVTNMVGNIVAGIACGPAAPACVATWNYEFGRAMGASSGQAFKSAAIAGASVWAFQSIGNHFSKGGVLKFSDIGFSTQLAWAGSHALAGGVISELQGGKFGHGFISAGVTKFAMGSVGFIDNNHNASAVAGRTAVAAFIGGTVSELTGGKFGNGARTAAMAHLFNAEGANIAKNMLARELVYWDQKVKSLHSAVSNWVKDSFSLAADGKVCAGPCIGGSVAVSNKYGASYTVLSGFGLRGGGGGGSDYNIFSLGATFEEGSLTTFNYLSGALGPVGLTLSHSALNEKSAWSLDLNMRYPGSVGADGGTGLKRW